jgi:hypothetical protein
VTFDGYNCNSNGACSSSLASNVSSNNYTGDACCGSGAIGVACALGSGNNNNNNGGDSDQIFYLPLTNSEGQLLPVHFLTENEVKYLFFFNLNLNKSLSFSL